MPQDPSPGTRHPITDAERFEENVLYHARLLELRWWDWEIERITRKIAAIAGAEGSALERE